jgi:hypothetical protein
MEGKRRRDESGPASSAGQAVSAVGSLVVPPATISPWEIRFTTLLDTNGSFVVKDPVETLSVLQAAPEVCIRICALFAPFVLEAWPCTPLLCAAGQSSALRRSPVTNASSDACGAPLAWLAASFARLAEGSNRGSREE